MKRPVTNAWITLAFLMTAVTLSFIDRQILSVLIDPIRKDLAITDFQVGLLGGPAFVLFYITGNLVSGWLADRRNRVTIISGALTIWSLATALCGLAFSFPVLVLTRAGVGLGEGALGPGVHSVVADSFEKSRLPLALSIYSVSGAFGPGLALLLGGFVVHGVAVWFAHIPGLGSLHPWQQTFMVVGLPGLALSALLLVAVRIPERTVTLTPEILSNTVLMEFWSKRRRLIVLYVLAISCLVAAELSFLLWMPAFLMRVHGYRPDELGATFGVMLMLLSAGGSFCWGLISTFVARRGRHDAALRIMTLAMAICVPFMVIAPLMPSGKLVLLLIAPVLASLRCYSGLGHATVQIVTPSWLRGRVAAVYLASASAIGAFVGPPLVGAISTYVLPGDKDIGVALSAVCGVLTFLGVLCLLTCFRPYRRALVLLDSTQQPAGDG